MTSKYFVHIIRREKFTSAIISYMQTLHTDYNHYFIVKNINKSKYNISGIENKHVFYIDSYFELISNRSMVMLLRKSNKIIVEGVFGVDIPMALWGKNLMDKVYMQFWGGDYMSFDKDYCKSLNNKQRIVNSISRITKRICIKRCNSIIFILPEEYSDFVRISGIEKRHFVAPVCGPNSKEEILKQYDNKQKTNSPYVVQIGNSASISNNHMEALSMLEKYKNQNIQIICPLSYGPQDYAAKVILYGKHIFGDKFVALTDFIPYNDYIEILSNVSVAIFLNNRQEALGNIYTLLRLGAKLYIRSNTVMWSALRNKGYSLFDAKQIVDLDINNFVFHSKDSIYNNRNVWTEESDIQRSIKSWKMIFDD